MQEEANGGDLNQVVMRRRRRRRSEREPNLPCVEMMLYKMTGVQLARARQARECVMPSVD